MPLPANSSASFYVPAPATPITIYSFAIPASAFQARFQLSRHADDILSGLKLRAMALDAGYGAPTDQAKLLRYAPALRKQLHAYQKARWKFLKTLLETDPVNDEVRARPLVGYIESTEKGDAAFILGCLGSRYATAEWLSHRKQTLDCFWHFSVYANAAVSISLSDSRSLPDYIAHATGPESKPEGHWYAVEAKGTLGAEDWSRLQVGLGQARLLKTFGYSDQYGAIQTAKIDDHAVSLACFENRRLHIVHVDPPAGEDAADPDADANANADASFVFNSDMVKLLNFYQGYHQFRSMTRQTKGNSLTVIDPAPVYLGELVLNRRGGADVRIAIPQFLYEHASLISDVLIALSTVTPAIGAFYRNAAVRLGGEIQSDEWNAWLVDRQHQDRQNGATRARASLIRRRIWQSLRIVHGPDAGANLQAPSTPLEALNRVANATIIAGEDAQQDNFASIAQLRARLDVGMRGLYAARLGLRLAGNAVGSSFLTLHGLLIMQSRPDALRDLDDTAPAEN
jgi:hypothetical protein